MEILLIIALAIWVFALMDRIGRLERRLVQLELKAEAKPAPMAQPALQPPEIVVATPEPQPAPAPEIEPLVLDTPIVEPPVAAALAEDEPLLLDTPLPEASNDQEAPPAPAVPPAFTPAAAAAPAARVASAKAPARSFEQWLSEKGLAWLGAAALVFGVIFFVSFAATQNWFTPPVQLACAVLGGVALIGLSEAARRAEQKRDRGGSLVPPILAAGGAVAFYATSWAAYGGYHFIDAPTAVSLLTLCALVLVGLSLLHGEALGVLAIAAALLAPALADGRAWPPETLTLYVIGAAAGGFALAALRRWSWTGVAAAAGLYFWFAAAIADNDTVRAMALLSAASIGALAIALRPARAEQLADGAWAQTRMVGPSVILCISSVLMLWVWMTAVERFAPITGMAAISVLHVALAALAVRRRLAAPAAFAVAIATLVLGVMIFVGARPRLLIGHEIYPSLLLSAAAVAALALASRPDRGSRTLVAAAGAAGAALLTTFAATTRSDWHGLAAWGALFAGATISFLAAWRASRDAANPQADGAVDSWMLASAALLLIGIEAAFPADIRAPADAAAALLIATGFTWRAWRMTRFAAIVAAALAVAHAMAPDLLNAALSSEPRFWRGLGVLVVGIAVLLAASRIAAIRSRIDALTETLSTAAALIGITAAFLTLRWLASRYVPLDDFSEHSLRALTLMTAGLLLLPRVNAESGRIGQWRGHALLCLGLIYAFFGWELLLNPWWGLWPAPVGGPPVLNALLLSFAAPAAVAFVAAHHRYRHERGWARLYAIVSGVLALSWAALELRRAFHPHDMATADTGMFEANCYALLLLVFAWLISFVGHVRARPDRPFATDLEHISGGVSWTALGVGGLVLLVTHHPWWGLHSLDARAMPGFAVLAQAWAATLALALGRLRPQTDTLREAASWCACAFALSFGHAGLHWLSTQPTPLASFTGYGHALWPLLLALAGAYLARHHAALADTQAVWRMLSLPALGFGALTLWFGVNPWWGAWAQTANTQTLALLGLSAYPLAAWLGLRTAQRWPDLAANAGKPAAVIHLAVGATLVARWIYHGEAMTKASADALELWTYSAIWALYGGAVLALGARRNDRVLRWSGLAILGLTTVKVFAIDTAQLSGLIRAASFIGLSAVLLIAAWTTRRLRQRPSDAPQ